MFGSEGVANVLQLATQAATPHQREVERDFPVESFSLHLPLILAIAILETNGTAGGWATRTSVPDPRSAGSDDHHIINFGSARRSVKRFAVPPSDMNVAHKPTSPTHRESYFDIAMACIVSALLALVAVIGLGSDFGSF